MAKAQHGGQRIGGKDYHSGATLPKRYRRVQDVSERPKDPAGSNPLAAPNLGRFTVPQLITFSSISTTLSKAYRNPDEAYRHSIENAHMMLSDPTIAGPLHARQMMTSLLQWSVESEDDKDQQLKAAAVTLSKILEKTPRFTEMRRSLLEAIWYGRGATQQAFGFHTDRHHNRFRVIKKWLPVSGDKLLFRYDDGSYEYDPDQIGVRMAWLGREDALAGRRRLEPTSDGLGYFLEPWERRHWCVHKHMIRDGEYEDPLSAGQIHGVGLRHFLYWTWYQKQETMAQVVEVIERTGMGITIYFYPIGNAEAEAQVKKVAHEQAHTNILAMPYDPATGGQDYQVQQIPPNTAGLQVLSDIVDHYYGDMIVRFILGQTLSSKPSATGMNTGVADLQKDSLYDIVRYDAVNLQETITREILLPLRDFNLFQYRSVEFFFKISTKVSAPQEELAAIQQAWQMGAKIRVQDLFAKLDLAMPDKDDKTVYNPQIVGAIQQAENPSAFSPQGGVGPQPPGAAPSSPGPMDQNEPLIPGGEPEQLDKAPDPSEERKKLFGPILYAKRADYLERIREAVENTEPNPSEAQREAGNYRKGVLHWHGLELVIETPKGQKRRPQWPALRAHYGYVRRHYHPGEQQLVTTDPCADGDHLDVFIGPEPDSEIVFVIDQAKPDGSWDEHKCIIGCTNKRDARDLYLSNYTDGWKCGPIRGMTVQTFKHWIQHGDLSKPIAGQKLKYAKQNDVLAGGRADGFMPSNSQALEQGAQVELEHTDNPAIAREIASDHLAESPDYYDALKQMETALKANAARLRNRLEYIKELGEYEEEPIQYGCNCQQRYGKDDEDSFLHLLGHIGDSDFGRVSELSEWISAWQLELNGGALNGEAAESPSEGLAEYVSLVLRSTMEAKNKFPGCWAVLVSAGLVEEDDDATPYRYAYEESEHPRDQGGRWSDKGGGMESGESPTYTQYRDVRLERVKEDDDMAAAADVATRAGLGSLHYMNREPLLVHRDDDGRINGVVLADTDGGMAFDFAVDPDAQGGGIGTKLVQGVIGYYLRNREKLAAKQDMDPEDYDLTAIASNPLAEQMLIKAGFRKDGEELVIRGQDVPE